MSKLIKAVVFDLGGVIFGSPLEGINEFEIQYNIPNNFINICIVSTKNNAFKRLECGELTINEFKKEFKKELKNPKMIDIYIEYIKRKKGVILNRNDFPTNGFDIDTGILFDKMKEKSAFVCQEMIHCVCILRMYGYKVLALTNNFKPLPKEHSLKCYFDDIIESSVVHLRKPNVKIYQYLLKRINQLNQNNISENDIQYNNIVFLDDIGINVKSAAKLGINTIKVGLNGQINAIKKLERIVNKALLPSMNKPLFIKDEIYVLGYASNPPIIIDHKNNILIKKLIEMEFFVIYSVNINDLDNIMSKLHLNNRTTSFIIDKNWLSCVLNYSATINNKLGCIIVNNCQENKIENSYFMMTDILQYMDNLLQYLMENKKRLIINGSLLSRNKLFLPSKL